MTFNNGIRHVALASLTAKSQDFLKRYTMPKFHVELVNLFHRIQAMGRIGLVYWEQSRDWRISLGDQNPLTVLNEVNQT